MLSPSAMAEMTMLRFDDLASYAEARQLCHIARDAASRGRHADHRDVLDDLLTGALLLIGAITETLHVGEPRAQLRGFREAAELLVHLRGVAYDAYLVDALSGRVFDELSRSARRCERELDRSIQSALQRARAAA